MTEACKCHQTSGYCQCLISDSQCLIVESVDPYGMQFAIDPDPNNIVERGPVGLRALLSTGYANPETTGLYRSGTENIQVSNGSTVYIPFDVTIWDSYGSFDEARNAARVYIQYPGIFFAHATVTWQAAASSDLAGIFLGISVSGSITWSAFHKPNVARGNYSNACCISRVNAGDWIGAAVYTSGGNLELLAQNSPISASLALGRLGSLS